MKKMIQASKKTESVEQQVATLKLELNYELAVLFEAMQENNLTQKDASIATLKRIRNELNVYKAL
ncbi:hypothetical protein [Mangrovibacillus cuniculi]|uniref:Uncharacterized protein n=1 Tax=Mangrovibacillus cuniculi TaxID=2593652 RepID=A0A7S8CA32_9BACI|nr:hypothetical protein [Mangrovibacillus cuniculi]QPC46201.1 hypothetical protein G8O30_04125 [Mangrovibacillus cuniculi]